MIYRVSTSNGFEFVRVSALRAAQLMRGCSPRVPPSHRSILTAQLEVVAGKVRAADRVNGAPPERTTLPRYRPDDYVRVNR